MRNARTHIPKVAPTRTQTWKWCTKGTSIGELDTEMEQLGEGNGVPEVPQRVGRVRYGNGVPKIAQRCTKDSSIGEESWESCL